LLIIYNVEIEITAAIPTWICEEESDGERKIAQRDMTSAG
jgi:hypothetical protein